MPSERRLGLPHGLAALLPAMEVSGTPVDRGVSVTPDIGPVPSGTIVYGLGSRGLSELTSSVDSRRRPLTDSP